MDAVEILSRWPSRQALADDTGRSIVTIHSWFGRKSIPADMDVVLVQAAIARGIGLTFEELARARAHSPSGEAA